MWLFQKLICNPKMDSFESKSQLDNQQHLPDPPIDDDKLVQLLAHDLETLILSTKDAVVIDEEEQLKQAIDDDIRSLFVKEAVRDTCQADEVVSSEIRVLEDGDVGESDVENVSSEIGDENVGGDGSVSVADDGKSKGYHYPLRIDAEDCAYYMRTGMCKFGSTCRFNHPIRRKNQATKEIKKQKEEKAERRVQKEEKGERRGQKDENVERRVQKDEKVERRGPKEEKVERHGQKECKYHTSSAGCKLGKACKFNHGRGKTVKTPVVEYNFVGLPIRPGQKECPYYMRSGSCKYGPSCKYNHPDPTADGDSDAPTSYGNDGPIPPQPARQPNIPNIPSWSGARIPDPPTPFVPMMYPPTQNMPPPNPDWNGYQAPAPVPAHLYPNPERALPIPPAFIFNNQPSDTNTYTHHQQPVVVSEYPERPGQPDCSHFMKTGDCKYRASCKFHHPQNRVTRTSKDQRICAYFSRHGTCKYGQACKYDHPVNHNSNSNPAREGYAGSNGPEPLIQQSV